MFITQVINRHIVEYKYYYNIMYEDEEYFVEKSLSDSDKLYLSVCAFFAVGLIFMASNRIR